MPGEIQRAFASGEVSPTLYGRVDVDRWSQALQTCRNWIVDPEGGAHTRQGFEYLGRVPKGSGTGSGISGVNSTICALPFEFGPDDSSILLSTGIAEEHAYIIDNGTIVSGDPIQIGTDVVSGTNTHTFTTLLPHGYVTGDTVIILDGEKAGSSGTVTRTDDYIFTRTITSSTNGTYTNIKFVRTAKVSGSLGYMQIPCLLCGRNQWGALSAYTTRYVQSADTIFTTSVNWAHGVNKIVREDYTLLGVTREKSFIQYRDGYSADYSVPYLTSAPVAYNSAVVVAPTGSGTDPLRYIVTYSDVNGVESAALRVGASANTPFSGTFTGTTTWTVAVTSHGLQTNESIIISTVNPSSKAYSDGAIARVVYIDANSFSVTGDGIPVSGTRTLYYWKCMDCVTAGVYPTAAAPVTISWTAVPGANVYNVYREYGRGFGYIGSTSAVSFLDKGIIPDIRDNPSFGKRPYGSPFDSAAAIGMSQQRLFLGGWDDDIERITASYTGDYVNFEPGAADSSGLDFGLAGRTVSGVLHMTEVAGRLVVLTNTSEWVIKGGSNGLTPTAINARADSYNGCSEAAPVIVGTSLIYVQRGDRIVRDAQYDYQQEALTSRDLTLWAKHLFTPEIKKIVYQRGQQHLWALMFDGTLRCLTYIPEQNIWGWHRHDISERTIEDICVVSEDGADRLYIFCAYDDYVEIGRLPLDWESGDVDDYCGFDMSLAYNGVITTSTATLSGGTNYTTDETLSMSASVAVFVAGDVGKDFMLTSGDDIVYVTCTAYTSNVLVSVVGRSIIPASMRGVEVPASAWYRCATTFSGLGHLNGSTLGIIADGGVEPDQVPLGGAIYTTRPFARLRAGLKQTQDLATLPLEPSDQDTSLGDFKHVTRVILRLLNTRGLQGGLNEDNLTELVSEYSGLPNAMPELQSGVREILMSATHEDEGSVLLRQDKGLPSSVLNARLVFNIGSNR